MAQAFAIAHHERRSKHAIHSIEPAPARVVRSSTAAWFRGEPLHRRAIKEIVAELRVDTRPTLFAFFVDDHLCLKDHRKLAVGALNAIPVDISPLLREARRSRATGLILAHASDEYVPPNQGTIQTTARLRRTLADYDLPLLDFLVMGPGILLGIGSW